MNDQAKLTQDQEERISNTLKRIRGGLRREPASPFEEPIHHFKPGALDADKQ